MPGKCLRAFTGVRPICRSLRSVCCIHLGASTSNLANKECLEPFQAAQRQHAFVASMHPCIICTGPRMTAVIFRP